MVHMKFSRLSYSLGNVVVLQYPELMGQVDTLDDCDTSQLTLNYELSLLTES